MTDKEKTTIITEKLYNKYALIDNTFAFKELQDGVGAYFPRRMDLYVIKQHPHKCFYAKAYEIKVSKSDFKNDLKNPEKQKWAKYYSNEFYYVAPKGIINKDEVPEFAGLLEYNFDTDKFKIVKKAPKRDKQEPDWGFYIASLRNKTKQDMHEDGILNELKHKHFIEYRKLERELDNLKYTNKRMKERCTIVYDLLKKKDFCLNHDVSEILEILEILKYHK